MVSELCEEDSDTMVVSGQCCGVAQPQHMSPTIHHYGPVTGAGDDINIVLRCDPKLA